MELGRGFAAAFPATRQCGGECSAACRRSRAAAYSVMVLHARLLGQHSRDRATWAWSTVYASWPHIRVLAIPRGRFSADGARPIGAGFIGKPYKSRQLLAEIS